MCGCSTTRFPAHMDTQPSYPKPVIHESALDPHFTETVITTTFYITTAQPTTSSCPLLRNIYGITGAIITAFIEPGNPPSLADMGAQLQV